MVCSEEYIQYRSVCVTRRVQTVLERVQSGSIALAGWQVSILTSYKHLYGLYTCCWLRGHHGGSADIGLCPYSHLYGLYICNHLYGLEASSCVPTTMVGAGSDQMSPEPPGSPRSQQQVYGPYRCL